MHATVVNTLAGGQQGRAAVGGQIQLTYAAGKVTGRLTLSGTGSNPTGAESGTITGTISGAASDPMITGTAAGTGGNSPFTVSLHVTSATCAAVSGDLIAMIRAVYAYYKISTSVVTISGQGNWTIPHAP